jgi:hypothetical protein
LLQFDALTAHSCIAHIIVLPLILTLHSLPQLLLLLPPQVPLPSLLQQHPRLFQLLLPLPLLLLRTSL